MSHMQRSNVGPLWPVIKLQETPLQTVRRRQQESGMAANYVIVANFCDRAWPFLKFQKKTVT